MRLAFAMATAIVCSSCVDDPDILPSPPSDFPTTVSSSASGGSSGNRIGFYGMASSDGAWQFAGWYDSELSIKCALRKLYNGNTYCVPTEHLVESVISSGEANAVHYVDEDCETAFLEWSVESSCNEPPPRYALHMLYEPSNVCGAYNEQQLYRLGEPIEITAGDKWYQIVGRECVGLLDAPPGVHRGVTATKIAEDEFVLFTESRN